MAAERSSKRVQRVLTDHDEIREWVESRSARPACVKGTEAKANGCLLRVDFPGYSGAESLQEIPWDQWFRLFDDRELSLVVEDRMADGTPSNFNKLVGRRTAHA